MAGIPLELARLEEGRTSRLAPHGFSIIEFDGMSKALNIHSFFALLLILYIPISGIPDVIDTLRGEGLVRGAGIHSNLFLLVLRDILVFINIALFSVTFFLFNGVAPRIRFFYLFIVMIALSIVIAFVKFSSAIALISLRTYEYFPLLFVFYYCARNYPSFPRQLITAVLAIFLIEFLIAIPQTQIMLVGEGGESMFGARAVGTFNNPSTLAYFSSLCIFCVLFMSQMRPSMKYIYCLLGVLTILMGASRGALLTATGIIFMWLIFRTRGIARYATVMISITCSFLLVHFAEVVTNRHAPPIMSDSRWQILKDALGDMSVLEILFGISGAARSNALISLANVYPSLVPAPERLLQFAESNFVALLAQVGTVGFVIFHLVIISVSIKAGWRGLCLFGALMLMGVSSSWMEMYPSVLLIFAFYGVLIARERELRLRCPSTKSLISGNSITPA